MNENKRTSIPFYILGVVILASVFGLGFYLNSEKQPEQPLSSVAQGGEYHSTSTVAMNGNTAWAVDEQRTIATTTPFGSTIMGDSRLTPVTLGSVVISSTSPAGLFTIRNATSTTDKASTTVAIFDNSTAVAAGTYTFDLVLDRGLVIEMGTGFAGGYTITWR